MALNNAAADAAVDAWLAQIDPQPSAANLALMKTEFYKMFRAIFASIVANAIVSPTGSPVMNIGGSPVLGNGRIT